MSKQASWTLGGRGARGIARIGAFLALTFAAAGVAQAQTAAPAPAKADDSSLTWKGITLYGIIDLGVQYDTHSAPFSDYFPPGSNVARPEERLRLARGDHPEQPVAVRIGFSGNEPIGGDWAAVFKLETFFNPNRATSPMASNRSRSTTVNR